MSNSGIDTHTPVIPGVSQRFTLMIINALQSKQVDKAVVLGSRALGSYKVGSDIDIALFGLQDYSHYLRACKAIEELELPYATDLVNYNTISNEALREHINRVGVPLL